MFRGRRGVGELRSSEVAEFLVNFLIGFPLGLLAENAGEWFLHRYVLHRLGKRRDSMWSYHWHEHHRICRENGMIDPGYRGLPLRWNTQGKEALFLLSVVLLHATLIPFAPGYVAGMYLALGLYYARHRRAHLDPEWARRHLPWHYQHHMGDNPNVNWCITWTWFDRLMNTSLQDG